MVEKKQPWPAGQGVVVNSSVPAVTEDSDLDAVWRVALALDLEDRSVIEAEVLISRICAAKHLPRSAIRRALHDEWEPER